MSNKIILKTINGIGDKFINLIGASVYCYYKKYDLKIILNENILNYYFGSHNFYDLSLFNFNNINVYNHVNDLYNAEGLVELLQFHNPDTIVSITPYCIYEKLNSEGIIVSFKEVSHMFIKISKNIQPSNLILKYIPDNIENTYGIHLRNTDKIKGNPDIRHEMSYNENDILLNKLLITLETIIEEEYIPSFFISSENKDHKNDFIRKIQQLATNKKKIIKILNIDEKIDTDTNVKTIPNFHSILDMFSLSKCKNIFQGVKYSAFSVVAALIGNQKLINLSKCLETDQLCIIYLWNSVISINNIIVYDKNVYLNLINKYKELSLFYGDTFVSVYKN